MSNRRVTGLALGAAGLLAACLVAAGTPEPQAGPKPFRLGVVNLKECFKKDRYDRMKQVHADIGKLRKQYSDELKDLNKKVSKLKERMDAVPAGTDLYRDLFVQYRMTESEIKMKRELNQYSLREKSSDMVRAVYNEIRRVVKLVGQEQKYDLILRVEEPEIEGEDPVSVNQQISSRVVLYQNATVDVTEAVIKRLNEEWAKKKAAGPGKKPAPPKGGEAPPKEKRKND